MSKTTVDVLRDAKALLERPNGWTQGAMARDAAGVPAEYDEGTCHCSWGAIAAAAGYGRESEPSRDAYARAYRALSEAVRGNIVAFNNDPARTLPEVLAKFDEAIAAEEAKLKGGEVAA